MGTGDKQTIRSCGKPQHWLDVERLRQGLLCRFFAQIMLIRIIESSERNCWWWRRTYPPYAPAMFSSSQPWPHVHTRQPLPQWPAIRTFRSTGYRRRLCTNERHIHKALYMIPGDREGEAGLLHLSVLQADQVYQGGGRKVQTGIYPRPQTVVAILRSSPQLQDLTDGKLPV